MVVVVVTGLKTSNRNDPMVFCLPATGLSSFCYNNATLQVYASVFGVTAGAYVGLTSVVLVDLLGLEKLTNAFGLLLLFQGVASLIGPPIAGPSTTFLLGFISFY